MTAPVERTYGIAAFAALAGVTPRALRHYDRLGLLKPRRSSAGYRVYVERDLEALEEIVALKFIGVPLKELVAIRRRARGSFADILRAQRGTLEARRGALTQAIAAIAAAEVSLRSGMTIDTELFRRIIEVMHMGTEHEATIATYTAMLKTKAAHLAALSPEQRADLQRQWTALLDDIRGSLDQDPAGSNGQALLDRWLALLQSATGADAGTVAALGPQSFAFKPTSESWDELWARRAEWMPPGPPQPSDPASAAKAQASAKTHAMEFAGSDVMDFIRRAREARGQTA